MLLNVANMCIATIEVIENKQHRNLTEIKQVVPDIAIPIREPECSIINYDCQFGNSQKYKIPHPVSGKVKTG